MGGRGSSSNFVRREIVRLGNFGGKIGCKGCESVSKSGACKRNNVGWGSTELRAVPFQEKTGIDGGSGGRSGRRSASGRGGKVIKGC